MRPSRLGFGHDAPVWNRQYCLLIESKYLNAGLTWINLLAGRAAVGLKVRRRRATASQHQRRIVCGQGLPSKLKLSATKIANWKSRRGKVDQDTCQRSLAGKVCGDQIAENKIIHGAAGPSPILRRATIAACYAELRREPDQAHSQR